MDEKINRPAVKLKEQSVEDKISVVVKWMFTVQFIQLLYTFKNVLKMGKTKNDLHIANYEK